MSIDFGSVWPIAGVVLYVATLVWAFVDGTRRGRIGLPAVLLVGLLVWPISILVWILFRPAVSELTEEGIEPRQDEEQPEAA